MDRLSRISRLIQITLNRWKASVRGEAEKQWTTAPLKGKLKAIVINFHLGDKPPLDVDNMSKPVHDVMNKLIYDDDCQIRQAEISHVRIDEPMIIAGASKVLVDAVQTGQQFIYIRIEDAANPHPLPR